MVDLCSVNEIIQFGTFFSKIILFFIHLKLEIVLAIPEFQINFTSFFYSSAAQELK